MTRDQWETLKAHFHDLKPGLQTFSVIIFDLLALKAAWQLGGFGSLLLALVLLHAYLLLHEATHSAISKNTSLNDWVGHVAGWMILMPFLPRQRSHLLHHMWAGHPKGDPANHRLIQKFSVMTLAQELRLERIWRSWIPLLTLNDRLGMWLDPFQKRNAGGRSSRFTREIRSIYIDLLVYFIFIVLLTQTGCLQKFLVWYLPALLIQMFFEELTNLPHHAETFLLDEKDDALPYWEQHRVTHSCKSLPVWSRYVLLNFNLHTAHHLFPWVPWNGLPKVHSEIKKYLPELEEEQETRNEWAWSIRSRRQPLLKIMGHYFDKLPGVKAEEPL